MKIQLTDHYSGLPSGFKMIYPGVYDESDPRLYGLATYLVKTGHAVKLDEPEVEQSAETKPGIEGLTLAELKEEATNRGLSFNSRVTKAELIALIGESTANDEPEAGEDDEPEDADASEDEVSDDEAT